MAETTAKRECSGCGDPIPEERLAVNPNTRFCVNCAKDDPSGRKDRSLEETWGSRDAWKRDRASWKDNS